MGEGNGVKGEEREWVVVSRREERGGSFEERR